MKEEKVSPAVIKPDGALKGGESTPSWGGEEVTNPEFPESGL